MNYITNKLSRQLLSIITVIFAVTFICLGVVLPKMLMPVAEKNLYSYLSEPLKFIESDGDYKLLNTKIGYLYISDVNVFVTENVKDVLLINDTKNIISKLKKDYGNFEFNGRKYYYYKVVENNITKVALSDDSYINKIKSDILGSIFPIVLITCLLIGLALVLWSSVIVKKIEKLKLKIDNIDNNDYNHTVDFTVDDEIKSLALAIEDMRVSLINNEEYRNQMYQNISHDFKTPLTVMKSYVEAVDDGIEDKDAALKVISEQTNKLEQKVHSLLYLNKLDYMKDTEIEIVPIDIVEILNDEIEKFKFHRKDINFILETDKKLNYYGTTEHWETILDNLLGNFMRYAETTIKITVKLNRLILFNDGNNIDSDFLAGIFTPFRKGIKGQFGLGLSIVKKTLNVMGYDITIRNEKKGVSFIITKETK